MKITNRNVAVICKEVTARLGGTEGETLSVCCGPNRREGACAASPIASGDSHAVVSVTVDVSAREQVFVATTTCLRCGERGPAVAHDISIPVSATILEK